MSKDKKGENKVMVHVKIVEATNIAAGDVVARTSDPFIKLRVKGHRHKYQTRVIKDTLNPVWNEDFTFIVNPGLTDVMVLKLKDKDPFSDDFLGLATVPFSLLRDHNGVYSGWFDFTNAKGTKRQRGAVFVKLVLDEDRTQLKNKMDRDLFPIHRKSLLHEKTVFLDSRAPQPKPVKFFIGTWNVGNKPPPDDLSAWVPAKGFDLYAIGAQECEYKPRKGFSNCHHDWVDAWQKHLGGDFQLVGNHHLWQMRLVIFAHRTIVPFVSDVQVHTEATGIGSVMGNKGGVCVAMNLRDTRICFMNAHLAAHQHKVKKRNEDVSEIIKGVQVGFPGVDVLNQFHHIFWMGDLNYRLNIGDQEEKTPTKEVWESIVDQIHHNKFAELFAQDQLANEMKERSVFIGFNEGVYNFPPTFKVLREKELEYNEERSPAWCDRVLWRSVPGYKATQRALGCSTQITTSDHKPVFATFDVDTYRLLPAIDDLLGDCKIFIKSLKATDLPKADLDGSADPYVKFIAPFLKQSTVRTTWKANNRNPVWDASEVPLLELSVNRKERLKRHFIMIAVFDHDQTKDDIMCNGILPLNAFVDQPEVEVPFKVELFAGGLPAGLLEGSLQFHWEKTDFKPQILPPNVKANEAPAKK